MDNLWLWIFGCVGLTLIITTGKVFAPLRIYLRGFVVPYNPLRILGELLSCSMCSGFWIGFLWSWLIVANGIADSFLWGGVISLASYVGDEVLLFIEVLAGSRQDEREVYLVRKQQEAEERLEEGRRAGGAG